MPKKPPPSAEDEAFDEGALSPFSEARTTETEVVIAPHSVAPSRPVLTLLTGVNAGEVFALERAQTVVGRSREAWVRVDAVGVSRQHARIVRTAPTEFRIEDLGSTNGIFVNGDRVERADLTPGDQVQIGSDVVLRFNVVDAAQERLARQLYDSSTKDALTGAYNRKYFIGRLEAEVAYAARHHTKLGLIMLDIDHFKRVNDAHGHAAGDAVLRAVGLAVGALLRVEDVFARYGGEEFTVLVRGVAGDNVKRLGERVRKAVADTRVPWEDEQLRVTLSGGIALLDETLEAGGHSVALVALADARLYRAKDEGRNQLVAS